MLELFNPCGIQIIKSLLAFLCAGDLAYFKRGTCLCVCVFVLLSTIHQAAIHCKFPSDLKMDPFHVVIMAKICIPQPATSLCYAFVELPNPTALVYPPPLSRTNLERGCIFVFRCETRARHINTQHCPSSGSACQASHRPVSLWRQTPLLQ